MRALVGIGPRRPERGLQSRHTTLEGQAAPWQKLLDALETGPMSSQVGEGQKLVDARPVEHRTAKACIERDVQTRADNRYAVLLKATGRDDSGRVAQHINPCLGEVSDDRHVATPERLDDIQASRTDDPCGLGRREGRD